MEWQDQTVVFIGDSIVYGSGASDNAHRWTSVLCTAKGAIEVNLGITGEALQHGTTSTHTVFDEATIPDRDETSRYLFMALGLNDIALNNGSFTPAGYSAALDSFVTAAIDKGWEANQIVFVTPSYVTTYAAAVGTDGVTVAATTARHLDYISAMSDLATARGCVFADLYSEMANALSPSLMLNIDGVHPNDTGHQFISDFMGSISYVPNQDLDASGISMITASLSGSWNSFDGNASGQYGDVQFFKDDQNVVHMRGLCKNGIGTGSASPGTVILVLPTGYRPKTISVFPVISDNNLAGIEIIASNGEIRCRFNCSGQWVSFHGVSFIAES